MKKILYLFIAFTAITLYGCDSHSEEEENIGIKNNQILCTDGNTYTYNRCMELGKEPIAVVFYSNDDGKTDGSGYAVYLWDIESEAFADSLYVRQNTSSDITKYDGNINTFKIYATKGVDSPMAESVLDMWKYGQCAFVPSVAEMKLLYEAIETVNPQIIKCGGTPLPKDTEDCWYWTSTEVEGQETVKAWLYSMSSGAFQETRKDQEHKIRPIITLRY